MAFKFSHVCRLLEDIESIVRRENQLPPERKNKKTTKIIIDWFAKHRDVLMLPTTNGPAILSILFPERRKDLVYGMKEPAFAKKLSKLMRFSPLQKTMLYKYSERGNGDLPTCAQLATKKWDGSLMVDAIAVDNILEVLEQLAAKYRFSSPGVRSKQNLEINSDDLLQKVLVKLRSWEIKWFLRVVLRQPTSVSLNDMLVLREYHFLLPELLHFQDDFEAVFALLRGPLSSFDSKPAFRLQKSLRVQASEHLLPVVGVKVGRPQFCKAWSWRNCFDMLGKRVWVADLKYDGEYCEIHVNLLNGDDCIQIFSKSGKDSTQDRRALHDDIKKALRIGTPECQIKSNCIVLGELVVYSDREQRILEFHKIRKHIKRSGSFLGTCQDSQPHEYEHLMVVFFDVLLLDEDVVMRRGLQMRRSILRNLVKYIPGRSMRSEWALLDFRSTGAEELKDLFARALALRNEGYILKPLLSPYFPLQTQQGERLPNFFVKLKKDYLADMGGSKDVGDFAVVGARYDSRMARKTGMEESIRWTDFYLGCLINKQAVRFGDKRQFKIVAVLKSDCCIPKADLAYLNQHGQYYEVKYQQGQDLEPFDIVGSYGYDPPMDVAFREPFVVEVLGSGYDKPANERFLMLRHPRVKKIHRDRTWRDTVCMEELRQMAEQDRGMPSPDLNPDGIAADVTARVARYEQRFNTSQRTERTTQQTTPRSSQKTPREASAQQSVSQSVTGFSVDASSTQGLGVRASRTIKSPPILVRADTDVWLESLVASQQLSALPTPRLSSADKMLESSGNKRMRDAPSTDTTPSKRRRTRSPLADGQVNAPAKSSINRR